MTARTARAWAVLAALVLVAASTLLGSRVIELAAGVLLIVLGLALVALDSQRKRGRTRR